MRFFAAGRYVDLAFTASSYPLIISQQTTLPLLDNPFSQRLNAIVQKIREMRKGVYYPHLYIVKEDGEPPLRLWALSALIQDRADVLPSYQQFIGQLKDKVCALHSSPFNVLSCLFAHVHGCGLLTYFWVWRR